MSKINKIRIGVLGLILGIGSLSAQVRSTGNISNIASKNSSFLDASSVTAWNSPTGNLGKGLVFPRTDLTQFATLVSSALPGINNYPTKFDGMVVYNTASGTASIGGAKVEPGFYYYENKSNTLNGGKWKPFNSFANSSVKLGSIDTSSTADKTCNAEKAGTIHYEEVNGSGVFGFCIKKGSDHVWAYIKGGSNIYGTSANGAAFGSGL